MKWRLNEDSKIIVPGSEISNWYLFNGRSFEQITPTVNDGNLEFTVSKNKAVISLIRTNFDVLNTTQLYGKIKAERILESLKISNSINLHRVTGENLLTDGSFEEWDDEHNLTHWAESASGSSTVNKESTDVVDGDYAVRLDVDGNNSWCAVMQSVGLTPGIYRFSIWGKITGGAYKLILQDTTNTLCWNWNDQAWTTVAVAKNLTNTDWEQCDTIFIVTQPITLSIQLARSIGASSQSIYFDNAKLEKIGVIEHYDARGKLDVTADSTDIKIYAIDSQNSKQAELRGVWV